MGPRVGRLRTGAGAKVAACDVDVVMLCDPPGFRPAHFQAPVALPGVTPLV